MPMPQNIAPAAYSEAQAPEQMGVIDRLLAGSGVKRSDLLQIGAGLLSGNNWQQGAAAAFGNVSGARRQAKEDEMAQQALDLRRQQVQQGTALDGLRGQKMQAEIEQLNNPLANVKRGMRPIPMTGPDGQPTYGQLTSDGKLVPAEMTEGFSVSQKPMKLDLGDRFAIMDPITRQVIGYQDKNLAGAESEKVKSKVAGETQTQLSMLDAAFEETNTMIDEIIAHPGLDAAVGTVQGRPMVQGITSMFNDDVADFADRVKQLEGSAFLQAFESLKGGGQITKIEGSKATQAKARLSTAKSEPAFRKALQDYKRVISDIYKVVQLRGGRVVTGSAAKSDAPVQAKPSTRRKFNPATGAIE